MDGCKALLIALLFLAFFDTWECQRTGVNVCRSSQDIPCDDSYCIPRSDWCDGDENCRDDSDEKYCRTHGIWTRAGNKCTEKHFACNNGMCVPVAARCDGYNNCKDNSDENGCHESTIRSYSTPSVKESPEPNNPVINNQNSFDNPDRDISRTTYTTPAIFSPTTIDYYEKHRQVSAYPTQQNIYDDYRNGIQRANNNQPNGNNRNNYPNQWNSQRPEHYGLSSQRPEQFRPPSNEPNHYLYNQQSRSSPSRHSEVVTEAATVPYRRFSPRTTTTGRPWYRNRYNSTTARPSYIVQRRLPSIIQPRTLLNPPNPREPYPYYAGHKSEHLSLDSFFFLKNFTREYGHNYQRNVDRAKQWLLSQRDDSAGWGRDTPRALVALSLIANSFTSDISDNDLMMKGFQTHLGMTILRNKTEPMTAARLASYINALLATCQNPRNFLEMDLVNILYQQRKIRPLNPFVYLTLCLSDVAVDENEINDLTGLLFNEQYYTEVMKDNHILATSALACFLQTMPYNFVLKERVRTAAASLIKAKLPDGSFGNIYSTALAAQALMSVNISENWNTREMLDYIAGYQLEDGSFGDMMATYYSVPALSGRSLLHLRNTQCRKAEKIQDDSWIYDILYPPGITERKDILYTVAVGYPERSSISLPLNVPVGATLLNVMRVAAHLNPRLTFEYRHSYDNTDVHTISNIPNDPERKLHWNMYELKQSDKTVDLMRRSTKDIRNLAITRDSEEFLFWYLPTM